MLPRLYAILDAEATAARGLDLLATACELREAGVLLLQYRDKLSGHRVIGHHARQIRDIFRGSGAILILNDSPELCVEAGWDGVHVGQADHDAASARAVVGPDRLVGVSTHTPEQVAAANRSSADYIAVGPVFPTQSKQDAEATIGLDGIAAARRLTSRPLVAIGGISRERGPATIAAGADCVAVIGALLGPLGAPADCPAQRARELLAALPAPLHRMP